MAPPWILGATALSNVELGITYNCVITGLLVVAFSASPVEQVFRIRTQSVVTADEV